MNKVGANVQHHEKQWPNPEACQTRKRPNANTGNFAPTTGDLMAEKRFLTCSSYERPSSPNRPSGSARSLSLPTVLYRTEAPRTVTWSCIAHTPYNISYQLCSGSRPVRFAPVIHLTEQAAAVIWPSFHDVCMYGVLYRNIHDP